MNHRLKFLFWGAFISFLGSLPPGTMNIMAIHISYKNGAAAGWIYAVGSMLAELLVVILALAGLRRLLRFQALLRWLEGLTLLLLLAMSAGSFYTAAQPPSYSMALQVPEGTPFWIGVFLSLTNPLHIPFWMGWTTLLLQKKRLKAGRRNYVFYITGIGIGTMAGFLVFIAGGPFLMLQFMKQAPVLHLSIGIALLVTALVQLYKMRTQSIQNRYGYLMPEGKSLS
ncbi:MAG TPA: LysE family transporter [Flavisolibacter sp.]|jgi:threonine/homoserine/homoserine lactone efflux protein|nr:LysE family transporter [Flavisolibacter sp.]